MSERSTVLDANAPGGLIFVQIDFIRENEFRARLHGILKTWSNWKRDSGTDENEGEKILFIPYEAKTLSQQRFVKIKPADGRSLLSSSIPQDASLPESEICEATIFPPQ